MGDLEGIARRLPRWARHGLGEARDTVRFFAGVAGLWFAMTSVAFAFFYIPSESMQPTLEVGDRILVSKWAYGYSRHSLPLGLGDRLPDAWDGRLGWAEPERGDVVVLRDTRQNLTLIKRVIGVPGDEIAVREGRLYINGAPVERELVDVRTYRQFHGYPEIVEVAHYIETLPGGLTHDIYERDDRQYLDEFGPVIVPAGRIFLMGDNRDNSTDSRAADGPGFVPMSHVIGRAETVPFTFARCRAEPGLYCPSGRVWRGL
ncbi:signal peptidase I [Maricaulis sp.]|uniref:signal peptidase I n=1 Tax=Maricaulis sp. TaxID=1486257 RepID=UPI003A95DEE6